MYEILRDNSAFAVLFSVSPVPGGDIDDLQADSKDVVKTLRSITSKGLAGGVTLQERREPIIERNDAIDLNWGKVGSAFLIFRTGDGQHCEPIRVQLTAPVSPEEFARLSAIPLSPPPGPNDRSIVPKPRSAVRHTKSAEYDTRRAQMRALLDEIIASQKWQIVEPPPNNEGAGP
jgi:hypothetical protein